MSPKHLATGFFALGIGVLVCRSFRPAAFSEKGHRRMTISRLFMTLALLLGSVSLGIAHSPMKSTSPSDMEVLKTEPKMLHLIFAAPARVMKVVMSHTKKDASHEVRLELPSREFVTEMHLTPGFMGPGAYEIAWRALGEDGHVLEGDFSFEVTGE